MSRVTCFPLPAIADYITGRDGGQDRGSAIVLRKARFLTRKHHQSETTASHIIDAPRASRTPLPASRIMAACRTKKVDAFHLLYPFFGWQTVWARAPWAARENFTAARQALRTQPARVHLDYNDTSPEMSFRTRRGTKARGPSSASSCLWAVEGFSAGGGALTAASVPADGGGAGVPLSTPGRKPAATSDEERCSHVGPLRHHKDHARERPSPPCDPGPTRGGPPLRCSPARAQPRECFRGG